MNAYIETSKEFRNSQASTDSVDKLYDLLYALEAEDRTNSEDSTLANLYTLLGFHKSAYETFKRVVDQKDKKAISKLYAMEEKAKSHKNDHIIKDTRKLRGKKGGTKLGTNDFLVSKVDKNRFEVVDKKSLFLTKKSIKLKF